MLASWTIGVVCENSTMSVDSSMNQIGKAKARLAVVDV